MMMKHMNISIVSIPVSDVDRARRFYTDVLGFRVVHDEPMGDTRRWVQLEPSGGGASITLTTWFERLTIGRQQGLVLSTPDIDATHRELTGRKLAIDPIDAEPWGRYATFTDPDGNGWVLAQAGPQS